MNIPANPFFLSLTIPPPTYRTNARQLPPYLNPSHSRDKTEESMGSKSPEEHVARISPVLRLNLADGHGSLLQYTADRGEAGSNYL